MRKLYRFTLIRVLIRFNRSSKSNCDPLGFPLGEELGLGSEQSSDPLQICACGRGQGAGASEWASKLGVPAVGSYRRPVPTGHGAVRAGPAPLALPTSSSPAAHCTFLQHDGRARCRLHTSTSASRPPSPCRRCLMCPHIRPPRAVSQPQNSACAYVRARLRAIGVGFRAGGRAVKNWGANGVSASEKSKVAVRSRSAGVERPRYIAR